jgi:uncharacterized protein
VNEVCFADTNLFLRYLTDDDPVQADAVEALLQKAASGELTLLTHPLVVAEIVWALSKVYRLTSREIQRLVLGIINTDGIQLEMEELVTQALDLYASKNIDFVDAYSICWMRAANLTTAYTFDQRHFSRVSGIDVRVPGQDE